MRGLRIARRHWLAFLLHWSRQPEGRWAYWISGTWALLFYGCLFAGAPWGLIGAVPFWVAMTAWTVRQVRSYPPLKDRHREGPPSSGDGDRHATYNRNDIWRNRPWGT